MVDKSAAELEREKIKVTSTNDPEQKDDKEVENKKEDEEKDDDKSGEVAEGDEVETEKEIEENKEEIETSEKTEEELKEEKEAATTQAAKDKIQKRIDREVKRRKELETENKELKRQLAEKPAGETALTEEDVEARSERKAAEKVARNEFVKASNKLADDAVKIDKDALKKIDDMCDDIAPIPSVMIGILSDLDNGSDVLVHLANNHEIYEEIEALKDRPIQMSVKLTKLSAKIEAEKKPKPKPISKVPAPNEPLAGGNKGTSTEITANDDKLSAKDWINKRNADLAKKRAQR